MKASKTREPFRRLVQTGLLLNELQTESELQEFLIEEAVELSGAQRVLLILEDDARKLAGFHMPPGDGPQDILITIDDRLKQVRGSRTVWLETAGAPDSPLPSRIIAPLIAQNKVLGYLYADLDARYGSLVQTDADMLGMLASQAAVALEHVNLVATLEGNVEERTADLEQRNRELAIINRVQEGLAAELDLDALFETVGEKLREFYPADTIGILTYDANDWIVHRYSWEDGKRLFHDPHERSPFGRNLIKSNESVLLRNAADRVALNASALDGTEIGKSSMHVPLIIGEHRFGTVSVENIEREYAYDEADLSILTTLTNSMSVALENARLYSDAKEARAEAERANASKSAFMANMSHELRTPLNAIIGFTRIVQRKTKGQIAQKQTDNLGKVKASAEHLLGLINTVLDIAKVEAGQMEVINTRFEISSMLDLCAATAQPLLKPGVELKLEIDPVLPPIISDQNKVKQIVLNLLSNAAKFTHDGQIVMSGELQGASGGEREAVSSNMVIKVIDSGIGMNEEQLGRIFEEFQQAEETTQREYGGTGLGLPISKRLAQLLGGDLTATSQRGHGSTFTLTLPIEASSN